MESTRAAHQSRAGSPSASSEAYEISRFLPILVDLMRPSFKSS
jgi:hypothetical protein